MIGMVFIRCKEPTCVWSAPSNPFDKLVPLARAQAVANCTAKRHKMVIGGEAKPVETFARLVYLYLPLEFQREVNPGATPPTVPPPRKSWNP